MNHYQNLIAELSDISDKPIPLVVVGTLNAKREYGPDNFEIAWNEDYLSELQSLAVSMVDDYEQSLFQLKQHVPDFKLPGFQPANVFVFGTSETREAIKRLKTNFYSILSLFPPNAINEHIANTMEYSIVKRVDCKIMREVRTRRIDGHIMQQEMDVIRFRDGTTTLYPEESTCHKNSDGDPAGVLTHEIKEAKVIEGRSQSSKTDDADVKIAKEYRDDTWGNDRSKHCYFFHLMTCDLFAAVKDVLFRTMGSPIPPKPESWLGPEPKYPPDYSTAKLTDEVKPYPNEGKNRRKSYGSNLERDRWLFWKWQCGKFGWNEIILAALERGHGLGRAPKTDYERIPESGHLDDKELIEGARRSARRFAEKYAKHFNLEMRKGRLQK